MRRPVEIDEQDPRDRKPVWRCQKALAPGLDLAIQAKANRRERAGGAGRAAPVSGGAESWIRTTRLGFPDDVFDAAVATFVFCSVPDAVRGLEEVNRVVKPGTPRRSTGRQVAPC